MGSEITKEWLQSQGFREGHDGTGEWGLLIPNVGESEWDGDEPTHQIVWGEVIDGGLFLEAFSEGGDTLAVTEIPLPKTRAEFVLLLQLLGCNRQKLFDDVADRKVEDIEVYRFEFTTVAKGRSEVVVYGSDGSFEVRYANRANLVDGYWSRWYADRTEAEEWAKLVASEDLCGITWRKWRSGIG